MEKERNLQKGGLSGLILLILLVIVTLVPVGAVTIDQSIYSTGLKSDVASEINISDLTATMSDGVLDQGILVQKIKGKYDILSFRLNTDATQIPSFFVLSVYVSNLDGGNNIGVGTQAARVYAYNADGLSAQSSLALDLNLTYGWNDIDLTQLLPLMNGFGFVKFRIVAVQNWFEISEAKFSIINKSPIAIPNGPYSGIATKPITFRSDGSNDPNGNAITYLWNFGDGSTSTEANPIYTYASTGIYTVTLTVTDTYGASNINTTTATIIPNTFETIRPLSAYNPDGWTNPSNGYDADQKTYAYKITPRAVPSISFGGSSSDESINAWEGKSNYWYSANLYITFEGRGTKDDLIEITVTDLYGNLKHTILAQATGVWPKKEFVQKLNMSDWGDGFNNIADLRVRVNGYRQKGADNAESRIYDVHIDGDTAPPDKGYTRGDYNGLPVNDSDLKSVYSSGEIIWVNTDDSFLISQTGLTNQYLIHQFKMKGPSRNVIITWNGQINQGSVEAYAQLFKPNTSGYLTSVGVFFEETGSPNGTIRVRLKSELGGAVLAESNVITEGSLDILGSWKTFAFPNPAFLIAGNTYYIEIWRDKTDPLNYPEITTRICSNFEGSGWWRSGGNWVRTESNVLFNAYINNVLDVSTLSCSVPVTPDRGIYGLDWKNIYLEAYNRATSSWVQLDTKLYDGSTTDIDLSSTVSSGDYFDADNWITVRAYAGAGNSSLINLATDMIGITDAATPPSGIVTGTVTDLATGLPLSNVSVTVADSLKTQTTVTDSNGAYTVSGVARGGFTATFEKSGYLKQAINGIVSTGQTLTLNAQLLSLPPLTINITSPLDGAVATLSPIVVTGSVSSNAQVTVNGIKASMSGNTFSAAVLLNEGLNTITAAATDQYSQTATQSITVTLLTKGTITGTIIDSLTGLTLPSASVSVTDSLYITQNTLTVSDGTYTIASVAAGSFSGSVTKAGYIPYTFTGTIIAGQALTLNAQLIPIPPLTVTITSPQDGAVVSSSLITVTGNVSNNAQVTVNGILASVSGNTFSAAISLNEGLNTITAFATDQYGQTASQSISVTYMIMGSLTGTVTDSSTGFPISSATVSVTDSLNVTQSALTGSDGKYTITGIATGPFSWSITKGGYISYTSSGTMGSGLTLTLDIQAAPLPPLTINITSPADGAVFNLSPITVTGNVSNNAQVTVNGIQASVSSNAFSAAISLNEGLNTITASAADQYSQTATQSISVTLILPVPPAISNIAVSNIMTNSATVSWVTNQPASAIFEYGTTTAYGITYSNPTLSTANSITLTNLAPATTYYFRITATNSSGLSSSSGNQTFTTQNPTAQVTIAIISPSDGATFSTTDVTVRGSIINTTGNDTGVTVNGMPAAIYNNLFVVNGVPLTDGPNTITATATDTAGNTATTFITINAITIGYYINLTASTESGIAPLEVTLKIDGSFSIANSSISVAGPAGVEWLSTSAQEYRVRLNAEGVYYFTVSATGPDGNLYEDAVAITALNQAQMDNQLKTKLDGMKTAMVNGDIEGAISYFAEDSRNSFRQQFTALSSILPQIASEMGAITLVNVKGDMAEYDLRVVRSGTTYSFQLIFIRDKDGVWRIRSF